MKVGPEFRRTIVLAGGERLRLRTIRKTDREALHAFFHRLSPETRYRRFMGHFADLTPAMLTYLTEIDGVDHVAVLAFRETKRPRFGRDRQRPVLVGVARCVRLTSDPKVGEIAVTIGDELQGQGLGSQLVGVLVEASAERGIEELAAHVLDDNARMKRLLAKNGLLRRRRDGMVAVTIRAAREPSVIQRALRWIERGDAKRRALTKLLVPKGFPRWSRKTAA